jgi:hypothetical protein
MDAATPPPHPALIDRLLEEAAMLGEAARDHIHGARDRGLGRLHTQHELGVVATCLGYSVAWLLEQKAVAAGEIAAADRPRLAEATAAELPPPDRVEPAVIELGRRVRDFALRIERLAGA